jgi:hypothetical protein
MESLFRGAHATSCRGIGLRPEPFALRSAGEQQDREDFAAWAKEPEGNPDLGQDAMMMVPVFYDIARRKMKVWVFMRWAARTIDVSFQGASVADVGDHAAETGESTTVVP